MPEETTQSPAPVTETPAVEAPPVIDVAAIAAKYKRSNGAKPATSLNAKVDGKEAKAVPTTPVEKPAPVAEVSAPVETSAAEPPKVEEPPKVDELSELAKATKARRLAAEESKRAKEAAERKAADLDRERDGLKEIQELRELAKTNPVAALEKMGATPKQVADWIVKQGSPTNQVEALEAKIAKLEQDAKDRETKAADAQTKAQEEFAMARQRNAEAAFVQSVTSDPTKYEATNALLEPAEIVAEARRVIAWVRENQPGVVYDDSSIATAIETRLQKKYAALKSRFAGAAPAAVTQATKDVQEPGQEKQPPRTLTSDLQSTTVPKQDKPWKGKGRKEQNKILAEMLKKASRNA